MKVAIIDRSQIDFGERRRMDYGQLKELAESIRDKGLIQPIAVWEREEVAEGELPYLLLAGGRRFQATAVLEMDALPCRVYDGKLSNQLYREIELHENIDRKDLSWQERVQLEKEIHDMMEAKHGKKISKGNQHTDGELEGWSKRDTAELLNRSPASVSQDINIAEAIEAFPELADCKTKDEALKKFKSIQKGLKREELLNKIKSEEGKTSLDSRKQKLMDAYVLKDCFEFLKGIPDGSINLCEVDPPYAIALQDSKRDYDSKYEREDYNEISAEEYPEFLMKLSKELYRVMSDNSWLICWYAPEPWQEVIYTILESAGFKLRRIPGMWNKKTGQTMQPKKYLANTYEPFYYACKGNPEIVKQGAANVIDCPPVPPTNKIHPTERPVELIEKVLSIFTNPGDRIYCPFLGSGNTLLACNNLSLDAFGTDLSEEYQKGYLERVAQGTLGNWKSLKKDTDNLAFPVEGVE